MRAHAIGAVAGVHNVAVVQDSIDEGASHASVAQNLFPCAETLARGQHGGGVLIAAAHRLVEQHGPPSG